MNNIINISDYRDISNDELKARMETLKSTTARVTKLLQELASLRKEENNAACLYRTSTD